MIQIETIVRLLNKRKSTFEEMIEPFSSKKSTYRKSNNTWENLKKSKLFQLSKKTIDNSFRSLIFTRN